MTETSRPDRSPGRVRPDASGIGPRASDVIVGDIRRQIIVGDLHEGEALPSEASLMTQYGVSRPTIREAWRVLESEGLIRVRRGALGGALVRTPSATAAARQAGLFLARRHATLSDVHGARQLIECAVVEGLARVSASPAELSALHDLATAGPVTVPGMSACLAGSGFHRDLVVASRNKTLSLYLSLIAPTVDQHIDRYSASPDSGSGVGLTTTARIAHATVVRLIESGDATLAHDFWSEHLAQIRAGLSDVRLATVADLLDR